jgi:hypothetical protein
MYSVRYSELFMCDFARRASHFSDCLSLSILLTMAFLSDPFFSLPPPTVSSPRQQAQFKTAPSFRSAARESYPQQQQQPAEGSPAQVMFEFVAEQDNELTVRVGDQVVVGAEVDGWYHTTRALDGASGIIPASYVQLLQ